MCMFPQAEDSADSRQELRRDPDLVVAREASKSESRVNNYDQRNATLNTKPVWRCSHVIPHAGL